MPAMQGVGAALAALSPAVTVALTPWLRAGRGQKAAGRLQGSGSHRTKETKETTTS
ncbi:hypothetical protein [Streptomyces sp. bgisy029]|uniref:hypothetical protein n=1 Tax=Streptomyces sp. bgisy029 TaxID=3413771 RepID=UPI003D76036B